MTTLENRPNTALLVIDVQNGVVGGAHERDAVVANVGRLVEKARREQVPVVWVQHSDEQLARGTTTGGSSPNWLRAMPSRWWRRATATPLRTPPSRPCCRASGSGGLWWLARRPMRASARRCTARWSGGTTRPWSATPTRRGIKRNGGRRRRTRSSRTRTCTGPTRRRRGERPGRSRPRMSISAAHPDAWGCHDRSLAAAGITGWIPVHAETTVMTVRPILILSPFFRCWGARKRRPFSEVPFVEPRSSMNHRPWATWKRAWWLEANSSVMGRLPWRPAVKALLKL